MTIVQELASFISNAKFEALSEPAREQIKIRILDSVSVAIGALGAEVVSRVRAHITDFGRCSECTLIGGGMTAPDFASLLTAP